MLKYLSPAAGASKRQRTDEGECDSPLAGPLPCSFLSLNVNGLKTRVEQADGAWLRGIGELVKRLEPDVIAMQEVKLTAKALQGAKKGDGQPRERDQPWDNDKLDDWKKVRGSMLDKEPWCRYTRKFSCADWRYAGTLTLFKKGLRVPQRFYYNLELKEGNHDENGRVCIAEYSTGLRVVNLYAPNNGWNEKSNFASRRAWDAKVLDFVRRSRQEQCQLVIIGDLNVAHRDQDVSHPTWFREQTGESKGKSWTKKPEGESIKPADKGQPGFTQNEQTRFTQVLEEGHLIDTWRALHPAEQPVEIGDPVSFQK
jgi:exodeoxyribonuclease III